MTKNLISQISRHLKSIDITLLLWLLWSLKTKRILTGKVKFWQIKQKSTVIQVSTTPIIMSNHSHPNNSTFTPGAMKNWTWVPWHRLPCSLKISHWFWRRVVIAFWVLWNFSMKIRVSDLLLWMSITVRFFFILMISNKGESQKKCSWATRMEI